MMESQSKGQSDQPSKAFLAGASGHAEVEVINEDYADFVSLSGKLVNVDGAVLRMHKPLLEIQARASLLYV